MNNLSLKNKSWDQKHKKSGILHKQVASKHKIPNELIPMLVSRKINTTSKLELFFSPKSSFPDLFEILDLEKAANRIVDAIINDEKILIFGDYDVDGATSSSVVYNYLTELGVKPSVFIPDRMKDGYGFNLHSIEEIDADLIVTVDCGITSVKAVEEANKKGIDVIITDHHQQGDQLPDAIAIVNPNRKDDSSPYKYLAGVGVAFFLILGINKILKQVIDTPDPDDLLDLVAVGTVSDMVGLVGVNRTIVTKGLKVLNDDKKINKGLLELKKVARINGEVTSGDIAFQIGPRINAAGRVGDSTIGMRLFTSSSAKERKHLAKELDKLNVHRKEIETDIKNKIQKNLDKNSVVVHGEKYHAGVIGIVASQISKDTGLPCIVLNVNNGVAKGSGRSPGNVNVLEAVQSMPELINHAGGHKAAFGVSLKEEHIEEFSKRITLYVDKNFDKNEISYFDLEVEMSKVSINLLKEIDKFQPFGMGNRKPVTMLKGVNIKVDSVLKDKHITVTLFSGRKRISGIAFNVLPGEFGEKIKKLTRKDKVDVIGTLEINNFRGRSSIQMIIDDLIVK